VMGGGPCDAFAAAPPTRLIAITHFTRLPK